MDIGSTSVESALERLPQQPDRRLPTQYQERINQLTRNFPAGAAGPIVLKKQTSNLFRDRQAAHRQMLDMNEFNHVLTLDRQAGWIEAEGLVTFEQLTSAALAEQMMPAVVPQLKSITIGGAVAGVGIESSSFRYGLVHEAVQELDVLTGDGRVVCCTPDNDHNDLFFGFANSYGALGYATRVRMNVVPVRPYVAIEHQRYGDAAEYFEALAQACASDADFVDGVIFSPGELIISTGRMTDHAPYLSDYTYRNIYYRSIQNRKTDFLSIADYIWRWDTDWFWCSNGLYLQNPLLRRLVGPRRLNSTFYTKIMRLNSRLGLTKRLDQLRGLHAESVIQDVAIPIENAAEFLRFFQREIGIEPVWNCPIRPQSLGRQFPLFPMRPDHLYVNFGFWETLRKREASPSPGHLNRLIEAKVSELSGIKSLYSDAYYSREDFAEIYGGAEYEALKQRYDPDNRFIGMYEKCVQRS